MWWVRDADVSESSVARLVFCRERVWLVAPVSYARLALKMDIKQQACHKSVEKKSKTA